jgi:putative ABC transport system substrate-binding protein
VALGGAAVTWPVAARVQQPPNVRRIGFLGPASASGSGVAKRVGAFRLSLRELGYVEGQNIAIEFRWAEGKYARLPELAAELVRLKVDVIVTYGTPGTLAAKQATTSIPIVMAIVGDAVVTRLVDSIARPGGNITGSSFFSPELMAKRLELLKEAIPQMSQVAVLINPHNPATLVTDRKDLEFAAKSMNVELHHFEARGPDEFEPVFAAMIKRGVQAVAILDDSMLIANAGTLADLAVRTRLPSTGNQEIAAAGGMIGYGQNNLEMFRRAAVFVDKILKGAKPGDLAIERATKFELIINLKTAKALDLTMPVWFLVHADHVIE